MFRPLPCCFALLAVLILAAPASAAQEDATLWKAAEALLQADTQRPPVTPQDPPVAVGHPYLFESFSQWDPEALRRAVQLFLGQQPPPADTDGQEAHSRELAAGLQKLLEYYPLTARTHGDFEAVRNWVFDPGQPPALRILLLQHAAPGLAPPSAFGAYFQGHLSYDDGTFEKRLLELIQLPQESKPVQRVAMDTQLARAREGYRRLLARDPQVVRDQGTGPVPTVAQLIDDPKAIPMTGRTTLLLERHNAAVGKWAASLKGTADNPQREASVRAKAQATLETVLREFPIPNREALSTPP